MRRRREEIEEIAWSPGLIESYLPAPQKEAYAHPLIDILHAYGETNGVLSSVDLWCDLIVDFPPPSSTHVHRERGGGVEL